ncbi:hypothetical protein PR048_022484 [Dryococelus australis]|uniref:DDE-1 domain-containing protein n=1 Tax=Dryococelus australis TaxID=614101 RepID=A0ABQ9H177_9NEOP|nr:hypothetical protein PR048_022484 [Dryococelus australis]
MRVTEVSPRKPASMIPWNERPGIAPGSPWWEGRRLRVKVIAFDVAEASGHGHFFKKQKRRASKKWWRNFKERYGLTLRVPENLSAYRASMGNPLMIDDYFDKLSATTKILKIQDNLKDHIRNVDETGLMYVVKPNKVVAAIGKKYIYSRMYTESFIIFKGSRWNEAYKKYCLPNTQVHLFDRGWIAKELFVMWFQFFLDSTDGSPKPMLLLMDTHVAHITPQVIELAKENDFHILTFPSHTTHVLQPLDVGVYKALKSTRQKELNDYMAEHPTDKPNKQILHYIFKVPFIKAMSDKNIKNAFGKCGIVPSDRTVIPKENLVPSLLTERPVPEAVVPNDANLRMTTAETNPDIQTSPSPLDNILKLPTAGPRKEPTSGRIRPNPKAKFITENPPTVHQTVNKQRPQKWQKVEVHHSALGPSGVQHRGKATKKRTNVCVSSARLTVDDDDWTCVIYARRYVALKQAEYILYYDFTPFHHSSEAGFVVCKANEGKQFADTCRERKSIRQETPQADSNCFRRARRGPYTDFLSTRG